MHSYQFKSCGIDAIITREIEAINVCRAFRAERMRAGCDSVSWRKAGEVFDFYRIDGGDWKRIK